MKVEFTWFINYRTFKLSKLEIIMCATLQPHVINSRVQELLYTCSLYSVNEEEEIEVKLLIWSLKLQISRTRDQTRRTFLLLKETMLRRPSELPIPSSLKLMFMYIWNVNWICNSRSASLRGTLVKCVVQFFFLILCSVVLRWWLWCFMKLVEWHYCLWCFLTLMCEFMTMMQLCIMCAHWCYVIMYF